MCHDTLNLAPVEDVKRGTILIADDGFTCLTNGQECEVMRDAWGLFVHCRDGEHYLDGQLDDDAGDYIGFRIKQ